MPTISLNTVAREQQKQVEKEIHTDNLTDNSVHNSYCQLSIGIENNKSLVKMNTKLSVKSHEIKNILRFAPREILFKFLVLGDFGVGNVLLKIRF